MDHGKRTAGDLPEENLPPRASVFRGKTGSILDLSSSFADPFDFAVVIIPVPPMMLNRRQRRLLPLTPPTPMTETTHGAFVMSGMRRLTAILRPPGVMGNWSLP
jgi:hypothetical protein